MSLTRLALRLATQESLRPAANLANGPYPTLAQKLVYDSMVGPIDDLQQDHQQAVIVVYTEDEDSKSTAAGGGPPFMSDIDLVLELSIVESARPEQGADYQAFYPQTDGELETSLDLLEAQCLFALIYGSTGKIWRDLTGRRILDMHSLAHHSGEERIRLARRTLRLKMHMTEDAYDPAPAATPEGLDRLPEKLRTVVKALIANGYGAKLGAGIAADVPVMPTATPLQTVTLNQQTAAPDDSFAVDGDGAPVIDTPNAATNLDQ